MSRVVKWELGANRGHLVPLLPIAQRLRKKAYEVFVTTRRSSAATLIIDPAELPLFQTPLSATIRSAADEPTFSVLVQAWISLFRLFDPKLVVLDYSQEAHLAMYAAGTPIVLGGTGLTFRLLRRPVHFPKGSRGQPLKKWTQLNSMHSTKPMQLQEFAK